MTPYQHARHYASLGWKVFPCRERGKVPACSGGCLSAVAADEFDALFHGKASCNYGIATGTASGVWVLDVDGADGEAALAKLEAKNGRLPATFTVSTGSGGRHLYFRMPACGDVRNTQRLAGLHIDVRGSGGYVIGPGCIHPNGTVYAVTCDAPPAHASWLYALMMDAKRPTAVVMPAAPKRKARAACNSGVFAAMAGYYM